jgi:hypothetical protein
MDWHFFTAHIQSANEARFDWKWRCAGRESARGFSTYIAAHADAKQNGMTQKDRCVVHPAGAEASEPVVRHRL